MPSDICRVSVPVEIGAILVTLTCVSAVKFSTAPQLHHSSTVLPSNGEADSSHAPCSRDAAADRTRGGVGGGRSVDRSSAHDSRSRESPADMLTYRTHTHIHSGDITMLSEHTAAACSVQEVGGETMSSARSSSGGAEHQNANLRSEQIPSQTARLQVRGQMRENGECVTRMSPDGQT